jgi:hypothetical protein
MQCVCEADPTNRKQLVGQAMAHFFISHGATMGSQAEAVLNALCDRLRAANHTIFVDSVIPPGSSWRPMLFHELGSCDVGIVLLDRAAMERESWWIRREVYYLLWRHHLRSVRIRGVLLDGLTAGQLRRHGYGELAEIQLVAADGEQNETALAERALFGITAAANGPDNRMTKWIDALHATIRKVPSDETLGSFAQEIGITRQDLDEVFENDRHRFVAHQLIGRPLPVRMLHAILALEPVVGTDQAKLLARNALPALVDAEAAWQLLRRAPNDPEQAPPVFVLNAEMPTTSRLYVLRAVCGDTRVGHCAVSSSVCGVDLVAELYQRCERALMRMLGIRGVDERRTRRRLAEYRLRPLHLRTVEFAYLAVEAVHGQMTAVAEVIRRLRDQHPWLTVIVLAGADVPADTDTWGLGNVVVLDPALEPGDEDVLDEVVNTLRDRIDRRLLQ